VRQKKIHPIRNFSAFIFNFIIMLLQGPTNKFDLKLAIKCLSVGEGDKERERERERNKRMAGTEDWGDIRKNKKQSEGGRERRRMVWDDKGSETGLPASPLLFTIYVADMNGWNVKESTSGGECDRLRKSWSLEFAEDLVIVEKS
jgi:hypothetical protein